MKCDSCDKEGQFCQYPGNIPTSGCWCDECYAKEGKLYAEWKDKNPGSKPTGLLLPFIREENEDWSPLINFYYGAIPIPSSDTYIHDIWSWKNDKLEYIHDYIQHLFPLQEESNFNPDAPILTEEDIKLFKSEWWLQERLICSTKVFMKFLGLEMILEYPGVSFQKASDFKDREPIWKVSNHNWLRITRMIKCLTICGSCMAKPVFECVKKLHEEEGCGSNYAFRYWQQAAMVNQEEGI